MYTVIVRFIISYIYNTLQERGGKRFFKIQTGSLTYAYAKGAVGSCATDAMQLILKLTPPALAQLYILVEKKALLSAQRIQMEGLKLFNKLETCMDQVYGQDV